MSPRRQRKSAQAMKRFAAPMTGGIAAPLAGKVTLKRINQKAEMEDEGRP